MFLFCSAESHGLRGSCRTMKQPRAAATSMNSQTSQIPTSAKREVLAESLGDDAERSISSSDIRSTQRDGR